MHTTLLLFAVVIFAVAAEINTSADMTFSTTDAAHEYYRLSHLEYATTFLDVAGDPSDTNRKVEVGKAIVTHRGAGMHWYTDEQGRVRSKIGDLCVHDAADGVLQLAACGSSDWRYYFDKKTYIAGLIKGSDDAPTHIAVWNNKKDVYEPSGSKIVAKPFEEFKNDFGAEWYRKYNKRHHGRRV